MTTCVLGLGYVGTVVAVTLARRGNDVVGVDIDADKVQLLREGRASFAEPGLDEAIAEVRDRLDATTDTAAALARADVVVICVGTPTGADGRPDLRALDRVTQQLGEGLRQPSETPRTLVLRSTVPPGTSWTRLVPAIEQASGRTHGEGWRLVFSPEFLREGSALADASAPPLTVLGAADPDHAAPYLERLGPAPDSIVHTSFEAAELLKYSSNAFHAMKVAFANEIGALSHSIGVDGREVMDLLCRDTVLNISPAYLRPGNPFGGSCLPKDLRALGSEAAQRGLRLPLLSSILPANDAQLARLTQAVVDTKAQRIGIVGLAFKEDTDDLRHSPMLELVRRLLHDQRELWIHDPRVGAATLRGRNLRAAQLGVPHLDAKLVPRLETLADRCEAVVLARLIDPALAPRLRDRAIIDIAGNDALADLPRYRAIAW